MCGIAGIFNFNQKPVSSNAIKNMLGRIHYRGPDESGIYLNGNIGIGSVRLSIIDLSTGQQPISNHDNTLWIVYNGEVFNYPELRKMLGKEGVKFKTNSDTEVVLKCYEKYGEKCVNYFNGQFAFAIYDTRKQELFLARDRVGIRPLFYSRLDSGFTFGSEIKCLSEHPDINLEIDYASLNQVFTFWTSISPATSFKNIYEVPPGHFMKIRKNKIEIQKYWSLDFSNDYHFYKKDISKAKQAFSEILEDAVRIRLRADVPVAAYLSGGIDSSATTYYIKKIAEKQLQTFSIGFADKSFDESKFQNEVSGFLNTRHTSYQCSNTEIAESFPQVVWQTEIPLLRTAPVPMYLLSKQVRNNNIKVVITGEGADELLGGYNIFKEMYIRRFWSPYPDSNLRPLLLKKIYPYIPHMQNQKGKMLKFFFGYKLSEIHSPYYSHLLRWNNTSRISGLFNEDIINQIKKQNVFSTLDKTLPQNFNDWHPLAKAQWLETTIFMSGYLLSSQGDRMASANSVEGRYPFLDHRLIEFCTKLHPDLKLNGLNEKYILKKLMQNKLPNSVVERSKQAYRAPVSNCFLQKKGIEYVNEFTSGSKIKEYGIFDEKKIDTFLQKLKSGQITEIDNMALTAILSTQILIDKFIVNKNPVKNNKLKNLKIITPNIK